MNSFDKRWCNLAFRRHFVDETWTHQNKIHLCVFEKSFSKLWRRPNVLTLFSENISELLSVFSVLRTGILGTNGNLSGTLSSFTSRNKPFFFYGEKINYESLSSIVNYVNLRVRIFTDFLQSKYLRASFCFVRTLMFASSAFRAVYMLTSDSKFVVFLSQATIACSF